MYNVHGPQDYLHTFSYYAIVTKVNFSADFAVFLDTKSNAVTSRVITWNDSQLITLLIIDKYNAQEPRTVNTINNGNITLLCIP